MMAASMWRMNGLWRRVAGVLVLCALLLSNEVICQDDQPADATVQPDADGDIVVVTDTAATPPTDPPAADVATGGAGVEDSAPSAVPGDSVVDATIINVALENLDRDNSGASGTSAPPSDVDSAAPEKPRVVKLVVPNVNCVGKEDIPESNAVKAVIETDDCEATKQIIQGNPADWCSMENCDLEVFQEGNMVLLTSKDANLGTLAEALQSEQLKDKLGVKKTETPSSSGSSVFVGILVAGLLSALAITVGYFKCQRRSDPKGVRLAEEAYPVDQENQGNTLVSVAPLNPPPETQEKPSVNGESPEAAKTQPPSPPPTNGHSTAKTADTEL